MDQLYTKHLGSISTLADKIKDTLDSIPSNDGTMEEEEIRYALDNALDKLLDAKRAIEYYTKPTKEGVLIENSSGKFQIMFDEGGKSYEFSCSYPIELYIDGIWISGHVEHTSINSESGYYFYGANKPFLREGMRARIRD